MARTFNTPWSPATHSSSSLSLITKPKMTIPFRLMYFSLFRSCVHVSNHCFSVFLPEKHPGTGKIKRSRNAAWGRAHSQSNRCSRYCKAYSKLLTTAPYSGVRFNKKRMHAQTHTGVVILIHPADRMLSAVRPIRGGSAVWTAQYQHTNSIKFIISPRYNLVCKQTLQFRLYFPVQRNLCWTWRSYNFTLQNTCYSAVLHCKIRTVLNVGWRIFDAWCWLAGLWSVTHLHVCLPGLWVCWRCPCAGKNTPLWLPRSHWLSANQRQSALPRQQVVPHTEHTQTHRWKPINEARFLTLAGNSVRLQQSSKITISVAAIRTGRPVGGCLCSHKISFFLFLLYSLTDTTVFLNYEWKLPFLHNLKENGIMVNMLQY